MNTLKKEQNTYFDASADHLAKTSPVFQSPLADTAAKCSTLVDSRLDCRNAKLSASSSSVSDATVETAHLADTLIAPIGRRAFKLWKESVSARLSYASAICAVAVFAPTLLIAQNTLEMHKWYNNSAADNFSTTHGSWQGQSGQSQSGYNWSSDEGLLLRGDETRFLDTNEVHGWFSPQRNDNFTTADRQWTGERGETKPPDYRWVRKDGLIFGLPFAGTSPLNHWYSPERMDNHTTTSPEWSYRIANANRAAAPGYRFSGIQGWMMPTAVDSLAICLHVDTVQQCCLHHAGRPKQSGSSPPKNTVCALPA